MSEPTNASHEGLDLDAWEREAIRAGAWGIVHDKPERIEALVAEVRRLRALEARLTEESASGVLVHRYLSTGAASSHPDYGRYRRLVTQWDPVDEPSPS